MIDDEIIARGGVPNRVTRQQVGIEIHEAKGQRWLCEKVLERVAEEKLIVIDGLRFPEDHAFFFERFGSEFIHLHIDASEKVRSIRYVEGEYDGSPFDVSDRQPVEAKIEELSKLANAHVKNESSVAQLKNKVLNSVRTLCQDQNLECPSRLL